MKRIYIVIEVLIHLLIWGALYSLASFPNWYWGAFSAADGTLPIANLYGFAFNVFLFYFNVFYLVPKFFGGKTTKKYWWLVLAVILITSLIEGLIDAVYGNNLYSEYTLLEWFYEMFPQTFIVNLFYFLISWAYVGPKEWLKDCRIKQQLEKEKLATELNYLKAQINPHFLFNGINSVYHLIDGDPELAKNTLHKFSNLLRYQLYECNDDFIPLRQELDYLENFITLQQLRKGSDVKITWEVYTDDNQQKIAPLLLTPFIENAFKYLSHHLESEKNILDIKLNIEEGILNLEVMNTFEKIEKTNDKAGGLGLKNVERRLALLYPNHHQLDIIEEGDRFKIKLNIQLNESIIEKTKSFKTLEKS